MHSRTILARAELKGWHGLALRMPLQQTSFVVSVSLALPPLHPSAITSNPTRHAGPHYRNDQSK